MENNNVVKEFFESPFAEDYLNCTDQLVRRSVTGISAACETLRSMTEKSGDKTGTELINGIMTMCCDLMRNAELSKALSGAASDSDMDMTVLRLDSFLEDFAKNCMASSGGKCSFKIDTAPSVYIRTNKELLRFLLLSFVRRSIIGADGSEIAFDAGGKETGKSVEIFIKAKRTFVDGGGMARPDVFEVYPEEVAMGLSARIGAETTLSNDSISVVIPLPDGSSPAAVRAPYAEYEERFFNAFNIMLRDLT
jgi:hypothetical protein